MKTHQNIEDNDSYCVSNKDYSQYDYCEIGKNSFLKKQRYEFPKNYSIGCPKVCLAQT